MKKILLILITACSLTVNAQSYQWAKVIGGSPVMGNLPNNARCVTTDATGNVYMTGCFMGAPVDFNPGLSPVNLTSGSSVIFFAKYAANGNCIWARGILGSVTGIGQSIAIDPAGNVYVTGSFSGASVDFDPGPGSATLTSSGIDVFIAKYDNNGNYLWARAVGGSNTDVAMSLSLDPSTNVYICGRFLSPVADFDPGIGVANINTAGGYDIFFAKYDSNGNYLWAHSAGSASTDISTSISTDAVGNAYIAGYFEGNTVDFDPGAGTATLNSSGPDIFFAKYDASGNYLWVRSVPGSAPGSGHSIKADALGNTYITGIFQGQSVDFDPGLGTATLSAGTGAGMFFGKYDSGGNYVWAKSVQNAIGYSIARNASGDIYIHGGFSTPVDFDPGPATASLSTSGLAGDIFFAKYDAVGNYIWAKSIPTTLSNDYSNSVTVDATNNVYITGAVNGTYIDFDPGPGTTSLSTNGYYMYLAKYAYCSLQVNNPQAVCAGGSYAINGHTYTAGGIYTDTLHTSFGCDSIVVTQMTVSNQQTSLTVSSSSALCTGSPNTLTATGAITYTWNNGVQTPSVVVTPTSTAPYVVTGTGSGGCIGSNTIIVLSSPAFSISAKQLICKGDKVTITANGANSYTWSTGAQTTGISPTLTTTTIYTVTGSFTNSPCLSKQTVTINVAPCSGIAKFAPFVLQISVYPNPAKNELFYTVNSNGTHRYSLTDLNGKVCGEGEQQGSKVRLDISSYPSGIYNLTVIIGDTKETKLVMIETR